MTRFSFATAVLAAALASAAAPALAAPTDALAATAGRRGPTTPQHPQPRSGDYEILSTNGRHVDVKCAEGGYTFVSLDSPELRRDPGRAARDRAIREACKAVDFSK
jgi:hypothetical protein